MITKHRSKKFNISFINLQTNTILQNLKQTLTCTNHKSIQIEFFVYEKTIKQVNTQTKYIYNKNMQKNKIKILKLCSNEKR